MEIKQQQFLLTYIKDHIPEIVYYDDFMFDVPNKIRFLKTAAQSSNEEVKRDSLLNDKKIFYDIIFLMIY
ncbi:hypothetical protein ME3_00602 [Bartonella melophagi K-2C]|uniref:Uncharacterized protein n=1 Tax=Bartonella melophagi K-2C TaxID=1094557 RepID=J1JZ95_9HYPH|nr:hypothetical protein ME3_00602 [Bartonella melophagi K-2C]